MHDGLAHLWYEFWRGVTFTALTFGFSYRVEGQRNIPRTGPVLLIANHQSWFDPILVGLASPRHLCFLARKTLFRSPALSRLMRSLGTSPVDQEGFAREGLRTVLDHFQAGRAVLIFPEGERCWDGKIHPLRPGVTLLIKKGMIPIVPVGIAGAWDAWPRWRWLPTLSPLVLAPSKAAIAVSVGKPLDGRRYADLHREEMLAALSDELNKAWAKAKRLQRKW
jgi:1-acyl-sn-glycerol-3-phosphate acyltransferase